MEITSAVCGSCEAELFDLLRLNDTLFISLNCAHCGAQFQSRITDPSLLKSATCVNCNYRLYVVVSGGDGEAYFGMRCSRCKFIVGVNIKTISCELKEVGEPRGKKFKLITPSNN